MQRQFLFIAGLALALASAPAPAHDDHHKSAAGRQASHGAHAQGSSAAQHAATTGQPGELAQVSRTIDVEMSDTMRFSPDHVQVKRGETIRFVVRNNGKVKHEMVLGSPAELKKHAALMRKFPEMEHADPNQLAVEPGQTGQLVWRFTRSGKFDFACLQPGHFEAGMVGKVAVK